MLSAPLTARAQEDLAWLQKKLGQRLQAPVRGTHCMKGADVDCWEVGVSPGVKGKWKWFYGEALEELYGRIREEVERAVAHAKRSA